MLSELKHTVLVIVAVAIATTAFPNFNKNTHSNSSARFIENKGQWPKQVLFGAKISTGMVFIESHGMTFNIYDPVAMANVYEGAHSDHLANNSEVKAHSFKIQFLNASLPIAEGKFVYSDYVNYFIGNNPSKWGSHAAVFAEVYLHNIYPGIDVRYYEKNNHLKYDFIGYNLAFGPT